MKRKALGKGLSALLPEAPSAAPVKMGGGEVLNIPIDRIDPNPHQPRQHIDEAKLKDLALSLESQGVIQPIVVRRHQNRFQIIAGERRYRAAQLVDLKEIPAVVRDVADEHILELALIENIQREDLNPIEEAAAYQGLITEHGYSQESVAERVGRDRSTVANLLRLLRLPRDVRVMIAEGKLSSGHARPLLSLPDVSSMKALAAEVLDRGLSVRDVERLVRRETQTKPKKKKRVDANTRQAERQLESALGTKVRIQRGRQGGRIEIGFHSEEELQTLYDRMVRGQKARRR